jgi:hypothetical protein
MLCANNFLTAVSLNTRGKLEVKRFFININNPSC